MDSFFNDPRLIKLNQRKQKQQQQQQQQQQQRQQQQQQQQQQSNQNQPIKSNLIKIYSAPHQVQEPIAQKLNQKQLNPKLRRHQAQSTSSAQLPIKRKLSHQQAQSIKKLRPIDVSSAQHHPHATTTAKPDHHSSESNLHPTTRVITPPPSPPPPPPTSSSSSSASSTTPKTEQKLQVTTPSQSTLVPPQSSPSFPSRSKIPSQTKSATHLKSDPIHHPASPIAHSQSSNQFTTSSPFSVTHPLEPNLPQGKLTSSSKLVNLDRKSYKLWFDFNHDQQGLNKSRSQPPKPDQDPFVRVLYPSGRHETFPLLIPKSDDDEYRPLDDLLNVSIYTLLVITTTLTYYLTPDQSNRYFSEPHPILPFYNSQRSNKTDFRFLSERQLTSTLSADQSSTTFLVDHVASSSRPPPVPAPQIPVSHPSLDLSSKPLLKSLSKSIRKKNAAEFLQLVGWYNRVIKFLVQHDLIKKQQLIDGQLNQVQGELPKGIWEIILRQAYDRQISKNLEILQDYETWSSNVYGELRPGFIESILNELIDLKPNQVFVDLGSGIGNIALQVALQIGCVSVGFEIMDGYSNLAVKQRDEVVGRADKLWNVKLGLPVLIHADFTTDPRVGKWLQQADVVLVNNQVFTPSLNESLTLLFLELKDSVKIISLKPFIPTSFKINHRNLDSPLSILTKPNQNHLSKNKSESDSKNSVLNPLAPGVFNYPPNSVSWTNNPGKFFITVVDRSRLIEFQNQQFSSS